MKVKRLFKWRGVVVYWWLLNSYCFFKAPSLNHKTRKIRFLSIDKQQFSNLGDNHQNVSLLQSYLTFSFQTGPPGVLMWRRMSAGGGAEFSKVGCSLEQIGSVSSQVFLQ